MSDPPTVAITEPAQRARLPWVLVAVLLVMLAVTFWISAQNRSLGGDGVFIVLAAVAIVGYEVVGAVIASRAPRNPIGWLLLTVGFTFQVGALTDELLTYAFDRRGADSVLLAVAVWFQTWAFAGIAALPLILLLFPDGRPASPRWRVVVHLAVIAGVATAVLSMFAPGPVDTSLPVATDNPLGLEILEPISSALEAIVAWGMIAVALASVVGIVVRWRRAVGVERQQIRILALTVLTAGLVLGLTVAAAELGGGALEDLGSVLFLLFFLILGIGIPAALGFTILRYRMYDLEIVIRKTVRFAVVAVLIAMVAGAALVVGSSTLIGGAPSIDDPELLLGVVLGLLIVPLWHVSRRIADRLVFGGRATPYEVLTEFSERMGESYATDDVLPRMAAVLGNAVGAARADVWLGVDAARRHAAGWPDEDAPTEPGADAAAVAYQGEELGSVSVVMPANDPMDDAKRSLIADLAAQAGPVLHNVRLLEDLRESRRRIVSAQDDRARKLERDIHDGVQQELVALAVKLRLADQLVDRDPAKAHQALTGIQDDAGQALENLRDLARGIYPPLLADQGLGAALTAQARKGVVPTTVEADGVGRYPREVESTVYFCTLEALNNAAKYADASSIRVSVAQTDGHLTFSIDDDGRGFDPDRTAGGTGLQGMRDRLDAVGGRLRIETTPGGGVRIIGRLPVEQGL